MQIAVALLCRILIALLFRQSLPMAFLHVLSQLVLLAIACNSFYAIKFGKGASWKGRNYNFS
jgi:chlorobactene glucosyltransferase